jgi:2,3-diketo-5-methylthio-1-phosphopentane phosphatase/HAD superfamily hydrolase (TIGR01509 family)
MKTLILCDFDGTITLRDMGYLLLNRFSRGDWETIDREFREGKIGSKEAYSRIVKTLQGDEQAVLDFIRKHSHIDPDFPSFYRYCREKGIDVKIVSDGLDFYIKTILEIHHLEDIPYYANEGHFSKEEGMDIVFPHFNEECGLCGTCKKRLVQTHRKDYDFILFVGNGISDRCGAREADFVFAKDSLYTYCIDQDVACHFYQGFQDVLSDLKKRIRGIIFDLDGTLIEAYEAIYIGLIEVLQQYGKEVISFSDLKQCLKADLEATLSAFFSPEEIPKVIPIMRKKYEEVYLNKTHFLDGAREILEVLHSNGILLGVASNKFGRFSRGALNHLGVAHLFRAVIGAGDVPRNKPSPDMIHAVLNAMNLPPEDVVFVGDTLTDIETGKQAGVDVYALPTGYDSKKELARGRPKWILRNLKEIIHRVEHPLS